MLSVDFSSGSGSSPWRTAPEEVEHLADYESLQTVEDLFVAFRHSYGLTSRQNGRLSRDEEPVTPSSQLPLWEAIDQDREAAEDPELSLDVLVECAIALLTSSLSLQPVGSIAGAGSGESGDLEITAEGGAFLVAGQPQPGHRQAADAAEHAVDRLVLPADPLLQVGAQIVSWPESQRHHTHGSGPSTRFWNRTWASTKPSRRWRKEPGRVPTIWKPFACQQRRPEVLVLTTRLNCMAR